MSFLCVQASSPSAGLISMAIFGGGGGSHDLSFSSAVGVVEGKPSGQFKLAEIPAIAHSHTPAIAHKQEVLRKPVLQTNFVVRRASADRLTRFAGGRRGVMGAGPAVAAAAAAHPRSAAPERCAAPPTAVHARHKDDGNQDGSAHHCAARVALWRAHCRAGIGVMTPIPYYHNLLFSVALGA